MWYNLYTLYTRVYLCFKGKSIHNQRIERLWRDVFQGCSKAFYDWFYEMERTGLLDPNDEKHLWCLHLVYLPLINKHLKIWKDAWVQHPLRSEKNKTPMQLWIQGLNAISGSHSTIAREMPEVSIMLLFQPGSMCSCNLYKCLFLLCTLSFNIIINLIIRRMICTTIMVLTGMNQLQR